MLIYWKSNTIKKVDEVFLLTAELETSLSPAKSGCHPFSYPPGETYTLSHDEAQESKPRGHLVALRLAREVVQDISVKANLLNAQHHGRTVHVSQDRGLKTSEQTIITDARGELILDGKFVESGRAALKVFFFVCMC